MSKGQAIVYFNGSFIPRGEAVLDIEDRGALFADGVYEVVRYYNGNAFEMPGHLDRLKRSLKAIDMAVPQTAARLDQISDDLVERNELLDARVYWQVTRGSAPRSHDYNDTITPTVFAVATAEPALDAAAPAPGIEAILQEDIRWHLCSIKSLMLLPNVLATHRARAAGAQEAILHRGDVVTEGAATSVIAIRDSAIWTHPADQWILGSITRSNVLRLAENAGINICERVYSVDDLMSADEVLVCGTTRHVSAVVKIDGQMIGKGEVGPMANRLHRLLIDHICDQCDVLLS
jgi:D-alanine transaminase